MLVWVALRRTADLKFQIPNPQFAIRNPKFLWRRGWDSNPRNGSPFTAFPVLPIQPLLHLSGISNCRLPIGHSFEGIDLDKGQSKISNRKSAMSWRRGWDSNPRWALTHSGFRDRCTNPLCDLSAIKVYSSSFRVPIAPRLKPKFEP